jgi:hypothetical protein
VFNRNILRKIHQQNEQIMSTLTVLLGKVAAVSAQVQQLASSTPPGGLSASDVTTLNNAIDALNAQIAQLLIAQTDGSGSTPPATPPVIPPGT